MVNFKHQVPARNDDADCIPASLQYRSELFQTLAHSPAKRSLVAATCSIIHGVAESITLRGGKQ